MPKRPLHFEDYARSTQDRIIREIGVLQSMSSEDSSSEPDEDKNDKIVTEGIVDSNNLQNMVTDFEIEESHDERIDDETLNYGPDDSVSDEDDEYDSSGSINANIYDDEIPIETESVNSTDSENDDENEPAQNSGDEPLYQGAPISTFESTLAILTFILRHKLTGVCISDLLELIAMHCIMPNNCSSTFYRFKKNFEGMQTPLKKHFYCSKCYSALDDERSHCRQCAIGTETGYFIEIPIISQLQSLFERPGFLKKISYRFTLPHPRHGVYKDIYDGEIYKELSRENAILANPNNISLTWNTDGVSIFKSSKFNIWPFFLSINELSFDERFKIENVLLGGMWFGSGKPEPNLFLQPLHATMTQLYTGIRVTVPGLDQPIDVRGIILCGTCDLPAKSLFLNMNQYNGKYGCQKCLDPGQLVDRVRVYPYNNRLSLRTDLQTRDHARQALDTGLKIFGVKGPSILSLVAYKCIETTAVDVMHCVYGGVVKRLLELWFLPKFGSSRCSISRLVGVVDSRLCSIFPPAFVQRRPRSIESHLKFWKASEFKNWFFYYSLVILNDLMNRDYYNHYKLLVLGVSLLCNSRITEDMLNTAERALREFVSRFQDLYGLRHMSCNLHHLLHLVKVVRQTGPLWTVSCFPFEDLNGKLKAMVHGSNAAQLQICSTVSLYNLIFTSTSERLNLCLRAHAFCKRLLTPKRQLKLRLISDSLSVVGRLVEMHALPEEIRIPVVGRRCFLFKKLFKNNILYTSQMYNRNIKTKSFCAQYTLNGSPHVGYIQYFIRIANCGCRDSFCDCPAEYYAVLKECDTENVFRSTLPGGNIKFTHKVRYESPQLIMVDVIDLRCVCFVINITENDISTTYVIEPVNCEEAE